MAGPGGRIPPDGRPHVAPGVGKNARRHDMEMPATPGLHNSDLQQGDVQQFERGQRIQPIREQQPAQPKGRSRSGRRTDRTRQREPQGPGARPDPIDFISQRLGGTLTAPGESLRTNSIDVRPFLPLLQRLATSVGSSGVLAQAYITQFGNAVRHPMSSTTPLVDMQDADEALEDVLRRRGA